MKKKKGFTTAFWDTSIQTVLVAEEKIEDLKVQVRQPGMPTGYSPGMPVAGLPGGGSVCRIRFSILFFKQNIFLPIWVFPKNRDTPKMDGVYNGKSY